MEVPVKKNKKETNNQNDVEETQDILQMYELQEEYYSETLSNTEEIFKWDNVGDENSATEKEPEIKKELNGVDTSANAPSDEKINEEYDDGWEEDDEEEGDVILTGVTQSKRKRPRRKKLKFTKIEEDEIRGEHMLTDITIKIAQNIMHREFRDISEFEDTTLGAIPDFSQHTSRVPFIQVLHTGSLHWVCVSNIKGSTTCEDNVIYLYESLNSQGRINYHVQSL